MTHLTLAQLSASLDEQLGGTTGDAVRRHLGICPDCRAWRDRLAKDGDRLRELLACEPDEDLFGELFDGIEAAIRSDAIADEGPRAVTMKRNLLGLVRGRESSREDSRPASAAVPRPAPKPPVLPTAGSERELEERGTPDAAGFVKPPPPVFPTEVKPSSAELVRPAPPKFAPPAAEGPRSGALSEPFTPPPPARAADIVPTVPVPPARAATPVEKAPAWHHESTPPERRPFEPIVGPRPDTPVPAPRPAEVAGRAADRASGEMRRPTDAAGAPDAHASGTMRRPVAPAADDVVPRSRVTRLEWMVAGGVLLAALSLTVAVWQWQHARNVERARRMLDAQPPAAKPIAPAEAAPDAAPRDARKTADASPSRERGTLGDATDVATRERASAAPDARGVRVSAASLEPRVPERVVRESATDAARNQRAGTSPGSATASRGGANTANTNASRESANPASTTKPNAPGATAARASETARAAGAANRESSARPANDAAGPSRPTTPTAKPAEPAPAKPAEPRASAPVPSRVAGEPTSADDSASWPLLCGQVFDEQGEPVAGARVLLADLDLGARTDRRGRFCLSAPPGDRTLSVVALGFKTYRQVLTLTASSPELRVVMAGAQ